MVGDRCELPDPVAAQDIGYILRPARLGHPVIPPLSRSQCRWALWTARRDDGLDASPRRRVGERLADPFQRKARGDEPLDTELRQERERLIKIGRAHV